ncbi:MULTISPECIES: hypothetical protein [Methylobacterium]|uniref:Lipoprotein n=1 Tax=Methylobacterium jeotgali TaxID=381630 RepID=A0ABQ4SSA1_9HYPH|nr:MULTISPECIES: hypothetical protein [Methylobacterium]PIU06491.1 MAG: hypothetical protein COT56_09260 [Methylobacterium sp. CG09_land_8_20_14_0_10_71_15]PIU16425.1 MAG: hypothetical protein COT28_00310 [Methylobacterium sp. CG08_land_8_20_14_0_20_71_15]GBU16447.1 hypothetical protein AwMethylo_06620 [Methylobacterium sp.]GJE06056.1 hypothetical protein AOPFMNJM_1362 [Methylobacterium jeotgali]
MRPIRFAAAVALLGLLAACAGADKYDSRSGYAEQFSADAFRRSSDTNGTQTRRDVNRAYTAPSLPSIGNRGI